MCNLKRSAHLACIFLVLAFPASAGIIPGASVYLVVNSDYPTRSDTTASASTATPGTSASLNLNDGSDALTYGTAGFGVLHLTETVHAHSDGVTTQQSTALVVTSWQDILTFDPGAASGDLFLSGGFWVHGNASTTAGPYNLATTNFRWQFDVFDAQNINHQTFSGQRVTRSNGFDEGTDFFTSTDPRGVFVPLLFPLYGAGGTYQTQFNLTLSAGASASTTFPGVVDDANTTLDLGNTILWGGLSVVDGSSSAVSGALGSATGFDWSAEQVESTPEPSTLLLAAAGFALFAISRPRFRFPN